MEVKVKNRKVLTAAQALIEPFNTAVIKRNWDALLDMCNEDILFMPPGEKPVPRSRALKWLDQFPTVKKMSWEIDHIEAHDEIAFMYGPVQQTLVIDGVEEKFDGKYCDVLRLGMDGKWRFSVMMWNANTM